jgi:hypothetical protein
MSKNEPFEADLVVVRRNPWMLALAFLPALIPLALALGIGTAALVLLPHGLIFTFIALALVLQRNPLPRLVTERVSAQDGALRVGADTLHKKKDLVEGLVVPRHNARPRVVFKRRGLVPKLEIEASDTDQGRKLLRAVGFDASQTVASFRLAPLLMTYPTLIAGVMGGLGVLLGLTASMTRAGPLAVPFIIVPLFAVFLVTALVKRHIHVGSDGVLVGWFGKKRFIAHSRIADARPYEERVAGKTYTGVDLYLVGGEKLHLVVGQKGWMATDAQAVAERIREAREEAAHGDADVQAALLARGPREIREWVSSLRGIGAGANASLRTAPVPPERLWRVVEDASAEPAARAGAAVALGAELDDERSARLRGVAQMIAAPKLRVAIERVADGKSDAELEEALAEVDEGAPEARQTSGR